MERKMELDWSEQAAKLAFLMLGIHFVTFWEGLSWDRDPAWFRLALLAAYALCLWRVDWTLWHLSSRRVARSMAGYWLAATLCAGAWLIWGRALAGELRRCVNNRLQCCHPALWTDFLYLLSGMAMGKQCSMRLCGSCRSVFPVSDSLGLVCPAQLSGKRGITLDLWTYEREQWNSGIQTLCGVDEAGAGPLAGPVYAAAVILPREVEIPGLNDSKKLTEKKREALYDLITAQAVAYSVARVEAAEIDEMDILNARMLAMNRAIEGLPQTPDLALIDGNRDHGSAVAIIVPHLCIVGGDGKSASIAAASILAKVSRDRYVSTELDQAYPQYQFAKHKGYGTKLHYEMLDRYGPCPAHRKTFLKKWEARRP